MPAHGAKEFDQCEGKQNSVARASRVPWLTIVGDEMRHSAETERRASEQH